MVQTHLPAPSIRGETDNTAVCKTAIRGGGTHRMLHLICRIGLTNRASVYGTDEAGLTPARDTTLKNPIALWVYGQCKFTDVKARLLVLMRPSING